MIEGILAAFALAAPREPVGPRMLVARKGSVYAVDPSRGVSRRLLIGNGAAWSPNGTLIAFSRDRDLWLANSDGSGQRRITETPNFPEREPSWSPDGRSLVYTATVRGIRQIRLLTLPGGLNERLAPGGGESWSSRFSPDGKRIAFVSTRAGAVQIFLVRPDGSGIAPFHEPDPADTNPAVDIRDLAWSPDGRRLAYAATFADNTSQIVVDDRTTRVTVSTAQPAHDDHPVWSPDGQRLAYSTVTGAHSRMVVLAAADGTGAVERGSGAPLDWQRVPLGHPLFPDLAQRPPSGPVVSAQHGHYVLGFMSLVDNRGPGPLWIHASRSHGQPRMKATQRVVLAGSGVRFVEGAGVLRYTVAPPHYHWHLLGFERYELRRAGDFELVVGDRKSGFCLADHYGLARGIRHGRPRFLGNCGQFQPRLRSVDQGTSVGYTDRYPANFHGQNLNLKGVRAGRYWLVHRVNSDFGLRESRYDNNAASLLVRITWPGGRRAPPRAVALRACYSERC